MQVLILYKNLSVKSIEAFGVGKIRHPFAFEGLKFCCLLFKVHGHQELSCIVWSSNHPHLNLQVTALSFSQSSAAHEARDCWYLHWESPVGLRPLQSSQGCCRHHVHSPCHPASGDDCSGLVWCLLIETLAQ